MGFRNRAELTSAWLADRLRRPWQVQTCVVRGQSIRLHVESPLERFRARTYATKEPETLDWIERLVRPGDIFYDIGANIGLYSLFAARHLEGRGRVYAFEPEALNHAKLNQNVYLNRLSGLILPVCLAISRDSGFEVFNLNPGGMAAGVPPDTLVSGSATHTFGAAVDFQRQAFQPFHTQGMFGVSIDELWRRWGLEFPNHIKIDVDGLEHDVLAGASATLADPRLRSILVEFSDDSEHATSMLGSLRQQGFSELTDFPLHSGDQLKGTAFEGCRNRVFVRPAGLGRASS